MIRRRADHRPWDDAAEGTVRVLLECSPESSPSIVAGTIERQGFEVRVCEGPGGGRRCDLLDQGVCSLVAGADVVVNMLRGPDSSGRLVLDEVTSERRPAAVVVEMTRPEIDAMERSPETGIDRDRTTIIETPVSGNDLVRGINEAVANREGQAPWWGDGSS